MNINKNRKLEHIMRVPWVQELIEFGKKEEGVKIEHINAVLK